MADEFVLAIDVGGSQIKAEVLDRQANSIVTGRAPTPRGERIIPAVVELGNELASQVRGFVAGVGLVVPGILDVEPGVVVNAVNLDLRNVQIVEPVAAGLGLPVVLRHDVTAGGYAEWRMGAGRGVDDLLVVIVGTGIAAVIVTAGKVVTGGLGQVGELGHVVVRPDGEVCACGQRGCVETVASAAAIARAYESATGQTVDGAADVGERLGRDDAADAVWTAAVGALSDGLLAACALFSPSRIVVGGGLAAAGGRLLDPLRDQMTKTWRVPAVPELVRAELGSRAGVVGAGLAAWEALDSA